MAGAIGPADVGGSSGLSNEIDRVFNSNTDSTIKALAKILKPDEVTIENLTRMKAKLVKERTNLEKQKESKIPDFIKNILPSTIKQKFVDPVGFENKAEIDILNQKIKLLDKVIEKDVEIVNKPKIEKGLKGAINKSKGLTETVNRSIGEMDKSIKSVLKLESFISELPNSDNIRGKRAKLTTDIDTLKENMKIRKPDKDYNIPKGYIKELNKIVETAEELEIKCKELLDQVSEQAVSKMKSEINGEFTAIRERHNITNFLDLGPGIEFLKAKGNEVDKKSIENKNELKEKLEKLTKLKKKNLENLNLNPYQNASQIAKLEAEIEKNFNRIAELGKEVDDLRQPNTDLDSSISRVKLLEGFQSNINAVDTSNISAEEMQKLLVDYKKISPGK